MESLTEGSRRDLEDAMVIAMGAAVSLSGVEFSERDASGVIAASVALEVFPDVTPRDLVALGLGAKYACEHLTEGADGDFETFVNMLYSLRATFEKAEDKLGVDLSGRSVLRPCAGRGE